MKTIFKLVINCYLQMWMTLQSLVRSAIVGWWPTPCWGTQAYRS